MVFRSPSFYTVNCQVSIFFPKKIPEHGLQSASRDPKHLEVMYGSEYITDRSLCQPKEYTRGPFPRPGVRKLNAPLVASTWSLKSPTGNSAISSM